MSISTNIQETGFEVTDPAACGLNVTRNKTSSEISHMQARSACGVCGVAENRKSALVQFRAQVEMEDSSARATLRVNARLPVEQCRKGMAYNVHNKSAPSATASV
jgi:hypothetical protein